MNDSDQQLQSVPTSEGGLQPTRCKATSKQTGKQCGRYVAPGFTVCKWHGAGTLAAKEKAQERLQAMVEKAITRLDVLVEQEQHLPTSLNAVKEVLDRGLGTVRGNAHEGPQVPLIQIGIGLTVPGDQPGITVIDTPIEGERLEPGDN